MLETSSNPNPLRPTLLWDGDCTFCFHWIQRWKKLTGDAVMYRPYQEALEDFPQVREAECREAVHLVLPDGQVFRAAHAVLRSLFIAGRFRWLLKLYLRIGFFRGFCEVLYRFVARNRHWLPH